MGNKHIASCANSTESLTATKGKQRACGPCRPPWGVIKVGAVLALLLLCGVVPAAGMPIGSVKTYQPESVIVHDGIERPAEKGAPVHVGDRIVTDSDGAVGITFIDGSVLSLGPRTEFVLDEFRFNPREKDVSFLSRLQRGTATFLSGAIGRILPESVRFKTPTATLGLRGTKILIKVQ